MDYEDKMPIKTRDEFTYGKHEHKPKVRLWSDSIPSKFEGI